MSTPSMDSRELSLAGATTGARARLATSAAAPGQRPNL
jgi:hypothetical protein